MHGQDSQILARDADYSSSLTWQNLATSNSLTPGATCFDQIDSTKFRLTGSRGYLRETVVYVTADDVTLLPLVSLSATHDFI